MHRKILQAAIVAVLVTGLLSPLGNVQASSTGTLERVARDRSTTAIAFTPADCQAAIKILTQYERLANKLGIRLSPTRIRQLDRKRANRTISTDDLPAKLRRKFPGYFKGRSLRDIAQQCFVNYGIGEQYTGYV